MVSILLLGFLVGLRHALDADHLAAVATMASRESGVRAAAWRGAVWGLGHTLTLFVIGGVCLLVNVQVPPTVAWLAEAAVGVLLVLLGVEVLWRMRRQGVHLHAHQHDDGTVHLHAHRHAAGEATARRTHDHAHVGRFSRRALVVGLVHGVAGSAALLLLTLQSTGSLWLGLSYIAVFGLGSILGMAVLSTMIAIPLNMSARRLHRAYGGLQVLVGACSVWLGARILLQAAAGL